MGQGAILNTYVFLFMFAFGFLIAGKRPILKLSTRALLIALFAAALGFGLTEGNPWHETIGIGTAILNIVFVAFAVIDYTNWRKNKDAADGP
ncbi:MAG: hypothetical protein NVS2B17_17550 [Candidatus Velthaea sp.]